MIKGLNSIGRYTQVTGGMPGSTYVNSYSGAQGIGNMRYNTTNQCMEVYDGNNWTGIAMNYASVGLTPEAEALLDWARERRDKELEIKALADKHPAVANALEALKKAEEQLEIITILSKDYEKNEETAT